MPGSKRREGGHPPENPPVSRLPVELDEILDLEMEAGDSIQWVFWYGFLLVGLRWY